MEIESRQSAAVIAALSRLADSALGPTLIETLGRLVLAHHFRVDNRCEPQKIDAEMLLLLLQQHLSQFELFAALRLIECCYPNKPRLGAARLPRDEMVRLGQAVNLSFATADISQLELANEARPLRLGQQVFGLFGANGALPLHLTEYVFERVRHERDETMQRFVDVFHHRMSLLFYRAWANLQPALGLDRPAQDAIKTYVAAWCGLALPGQAACDSLDDLFKFAHVGILSRQVRCADGLLVMLQNYFQVPVQVDEWVESWLEIPSDDRSHLGSQFCCLGEDVVLGERVWDCQSKFRIVLGPLSYNDYLRFLPGGLSNRRLRDMVRLYIGEELAWEVQLVLAAAACPPLRLDQTVRLGWDSWLSPDLQQNHGDLRLQ